MVGAPGWGAAVVGIGASGSDCCASSAPGQEADNLLHAAIYRLRRRVERATPASVPLQSEPRVGYVFKGTLTAV